MKKQLAMVLVYILVVTWAMSFADTVYAADNIRIFVDGDEIVSDLPPQIIKGRTLLPAKVIFELFDFSIEWDEKTRTINGYGEFDVITLTLDRVEAYVNGKKQILDVPATSINGRTMVPVRFIAENIKLEVEWDGEKGIINLNQKGYINPYQAIKIVEEITGYQYADAYDESTGRYQTKPELEYIFNIHCWVIPVINPNTVRHDGDLYVDSATGIIYNMVGERPWN